MSTLVIPKGWTKCNQISTLTAGNRLRSLVIRRPQRLANATQCALVAITPLRDAKVPGRLE